MHKAYDSLLCCAVDARSLAKTSVCSELDYKRYKCLCCGEEVYLAAAGSIKQIPHFRHRRGNNDTECEAYLGQPGAIEKFISERKRSMNFISFFFNTERMVFELGIVLQIEDIEELSANHTELELRKRYNEDAFLQVPINKHIFTPNLVQYFMIKEFSNNYILNLFDKTYSFKRIIGEQDNLSFFRIRLQDKRAKKVTSDSLYTNTQYVVVCEEKIRLIELLSFKNVKCIVGLSEFSTMGKTFSCATIIILGSDYNLSLFLSKYNLNLQVSESFTILWPPIFMQDSHYVCEDERVIVNTSFPLILHGNTNAVCSSDKLPFGITQVEVINNVIIKEKNIDISLIRLEKEQPKAVLCDVESAFTSKWVAPDDMEYFLFDQEGCRKITVNETIYLGANTRILGYKNHHLKRIVYSENNKSFSAEEIINDILKYHPKSEAFNPNDFLEVSFSDGVRSYLEACYKTGRINIVIKKYIEEGLL
ncbi:MAG: hypothetical protein E6922_04000 [Veillonella sp.]|nr:hypothetical protein [Veillonella sp.]MDU1415732.1 hypothetical protein [Veillonella sp.]